MSKAIVAKREAVLDAVAAVCSNNDAKLRLSYLNLLINFAILFADEYVMVPCEPRCPCVRCTHYALHAIITCACR